MRQLDPRTWTPPPGDAVSCGLRRDLPKRDRRHDWLDAGTDIRHRADGRFALSAIRVCDRCGRDDSRTPLVPPVPQPVR